MFIPKWPPVPFPIREPITGQLNFSCKPTVCGAENLIITITTPMSLVCFDKPPTSEFISFTTFILCWQRITYGILSIRAMPVQIFSTTERYAEIRDSRGGLKREGMVTGSKGWNSKPEAYFPQVLLWLRREPPTIRLRVNENTRQFHKNEAAGRDSRWHTGSLTNLSRHAA